MKLDSHNTFHPVASDEYHSEATDEPIVIPDDSKESLDHHLSQSLSMKQQEEQLLAEDHALQERLEQQLRLLILQRKVNTKKEELEAAIRECATITSHVSYQQNSPNTPVHKTALINRPLFPSASYASTSNKTPISAAALAKRQSIATLPTRSASSATHSIYTTASIIKNTPPSKFTGDKETQNADIEQWIDEANIYLDLSNVPAVQHLKQITGLLSGYALKWFKEKREEVEAENKVMTWEWLQGQLIEDFGRGTGALAQKAEWLALRMGVKNTDGTEVGGKSTYSVKGYTTQFTRLMRALTPHTSLTSDLAIIDRYCEGIRIGYPSLWNEMKGLHSVLSYDTLGEAILGAQVAESALSVVRSQNSSSSSYRARHTTHVNNLQSNTDDSPSPPRSPDSRRREKKPSPLTAYSFVYKPVTEEGRYKLSESQQKSLYDERRCYRCYGAHHAKMGSCAKKMSVAPSPLK